MDKAKDKLAKQKKLLLIGGALVIALAIVIAFIVMLAQPERSVPDPLNWTHRLF